jgi:hypothetical protein
MDIQEILKWAGGIVGVVAGIWFAFRAGVQSAGQQIPGNDFFERLDAKLDARVGKAEALISQGIDLLNPQTHGGSGNGPES